MKKKIYCVCARLLNALRNYAHLQTVEHVQFKTAYRFILLQIIHKDIYTRKDFSMICLSIENSFVSDWDDLKMFQA